jgi:predicted RNase H-like nuclease
LWRPIVELLDARIEGVSAALPIPAPDCRGCELKVFEDALDAVVCAWVGDFVLDGKAKAIGDETSAIWVPEVT